MTKMAAMTNASDHYFKKRGYSSVRFEDWAKFGGLWKSHFDPPKLWTKKKQDKNLFSSFFSPGDYFSGGAGDFCRPISVSCYIIRNPGIGKEYIMTFFFFFGLFQTFLKDVLDRQLVRKQLFLKMFNYGYWHIIIHSVSSKCFWLSFI